MSQKKRRGLQHGLSDILKSSPALEEKSRHTSKLLSQVADKPISDQINDRQIGARVQESPVTQSPVDQQTPVSDSHRYTSDQQTPVTTSHQISSVQQSRVTASYQYTEPNTSFTKVPNVVFDKLMALLDPYEFKVYARLYRLSHGFRQTQCLVGYKALADSCGLSVRHIKRVIPALEFKGLVKVLSVHNTAETKGTLYEVYTSDQLTPVTSGHQSHKVTSDRKSSIKDDHDDLKNTDHHQKAVMTIYQQVTGNTCTKADQSAYQKIKDVPLEQIEAGIRRAFDRAASRPGSLAYFCKEILHPSLGQPKTTERQRTQIRRIVERVREAHVGAGPEYTLERFRQDVERACAREGVVFDLDLFNEIVGAK